MPWAVIGHKINLYMKHIVCTLFFLLISINLNAQNPLVQSFEDSVETDWILENPEFIYTQSSLFTKELYKNYNVSLLQISGFNIPFTWDQNLSLLTSISEKHKEYTISEGEEADPIWMGTKVKWDEEISSLILFDKKTYKTVIDSWYLKGVNDCIGTMTFPTLRFQQQFELDDPRLNRTTGLVIIPFIEGIQNYKEYEAELETTSGEYIKGIGYDLNNDSISDVFLYEEKVNNTGVLSDTYKRLYVNVEGKWKVSWFAIYEVCI